MRKLKIILMVIALISSIILLTGYFYYSQNTPEAEYYVRLLNSNFSGSDQSLVIIDRNKIQYLIYNTNKFIPIDSLKQKYIDWLLIRENNSYYHDIGFDLWASAHALWDRIFNGSKRGSSTITMQLVKILSNKREDTLNRKLKEIVEAIKLTKYLSKKTILNSYFNLVPIGKATGFPEAAKIYFNKDCWELTDSEFLMLLSSLPGITDRRNRYDRYALLLYTKDKIITTDEFDELMDQKPEFVIKETNKQLSLFSPIISKVLTENLNILKDTVHSSVSFLLQDTLQTIIQSYLKNKFQVKVNLSFILYSAPTMQTICYINTNARQPLQYDLLESNKSLPLSRIKPFVYSLYIDKFANNYIKRKQKYPTNYDYNENDFEFNLKYSCNINDALGYSLNSPAKYVLNEKVGLKQLKNILVMNNMINDDVQLYPSAALGIFELSEINLVQLFRSSLYNGEILSPSFSTDENPYNKQTPIKIIDSTTTQVIRNALNMAIFKGTSRKLEGLDTLGINVWNKTGSADYGNSIGSSGLFKIHGKYFLYSLRLETKQDIFSTAGNDAVPLLKELLVMINKLYFLL